MSVIKVLKNSLEILRIYIKHLMKKAHLRVLLNQMKNGVKLSLRIKKLGNELGCTITIFKYPSEIQTIMYTTNIIEGFHRELRKATKTKSIFPSDRSLEKM